MGYKLITISRQFGSGGRTVGKELAQRLGIKCYDSEIIDKTAQETNLAPDYIKEQGEYAVSSSWFGMLCGRDYNGHSFQDDVWNAQRKIILELAEKEPCVIVGRCADYILRDRDDCLKVFIHADMESRAKRIVEIYGEREEAPEKRLKEKDKRRSAYYHFYTDSDWGDMMNYDIALNSGKIGIEKCVDIISSVY